MANKKNRPQSPKPVRSRSIQTRDFLLAGQGGTHKSAKDYQRTPKHRNQGWE